MTSVLLVPRIVSATATPATSAKAMASTETTATRLLINPRLPTSSNSRSGHMRRIWPLRLFELVGRRGLMSRRVAVVSVLAMAFALVAGVAVADTIRGTSSTDVIYGTQNADRVDALGGDDTVRGLGGADNLHG